MNPWTTLQTSQSSKVQNVNWGCRKEEEGGWFESQQHPPDQRTSPIVYFVSSVAPTLFSLFYLFVFPSSSLQPFLLFSGNSSRAISVAVVSSLHSSLSVFASYSASLLWARGSRQPNLHPRRVRRSWQLFSAAPFAIMTTASNAAWTGRTKLERHHAEYARKNSVHPLMH